MTRITRWDPFRDMLALTDRMTRMYDDYSKRSTQSGSDDALGVWAPAVDVLEKSDSLVMSVELPGIDPKDVEVSVENNRLSIKGQRNFERETEGETYHRVERAYGTFERVFTIPSAFAADRIEAKSKDGVLMLSIPKREEAKPKSIKVKIDSK